MARTTGLFVGRRDEIRQLNEAAGQARQARPSVVQVLGSAGMGKTSLLREWLADSAMQDFIVLRATADPSERDLAFGVIEQLLLRVPAGLRQRLSVPPESQAGAVPSAVGARLLAVVGAIEATGPVALVIDDAHWADLPSLQALGFVLRRLEADAVVTVLAIREEEAPLMDLRRLTGGRQPEYMIPLRGLDEHEVGELAARRQLPLSRVAVSRLRAHTAGSPLYTTMLLGQLAHGTDGSTDFLTTPPSLAGTVRRQLALLPPPSRRLVEAAAVLDARLPLAVVARLAGVEDAAAALEPALTGGWLHWWPGESSTPVAVHHALQRDAIYAAMSPTDRRAMHAAAVALVDADTSWRHRVAAADPGDTGLAEELEQEAKRQAAKGSLERAATLLLWASDLAPLGREREQFVLSAMVHLQTAFNFARAESLVDQVQRCSPSALRGTVLGWQATLRGEVQAAEALFAEALRAPQGPTTEAMIMARLGLGQVYTWHGRGQEGVAAGRELLRSGDLSHWSTVLAHYVWISGEIALHGPRSGLTLLQKIAGLPSKGREVQARDAFLLAQRALWRTMDGAFQDAVEDATCALRAFPHSGTASLEDVAYYARCVAQFFLGDWTEAAVDAERAIAAADAAHKSWSYAPTRTGAALVAAARGEFERAQSLIQEIEQVSRAYGPEQYVVYSAMAAAALAQARGDRHQLMDAVEPLLTQPMTGWIIGYRNWWLPLLVEALIAADRLPEAEQALTELAEQSRATPHLRIEHARLAGSIAAARGDLERAASHHEQALAEPMATRPAPPLSRALLEQSYGMVLRRLGRRTAAGTWLRRAAQHYEALGATPYLERCTHALEALGAASHGAGRDLPERLTDRELDIARLVARGLTNNEIAAKLFISAKTVEYHLGNTYLKLGLNGRRQLRDRIQQRS